MAGLLFVGECWQVLAFWVVIVQAQNRSADVTAYGITDTTTGMDLVFLSIAWKYQIVYMSLSRCHLNGKKKKKKSSLVLQILTKSLCCAFVPEWPYYCLWAYLHSPSSFMPLHEEERALLAELVLESALALSQVTISLLKEFKLYASKNFIFWLPAFTYVGKTSWHASSFRFWTEHCKYWKCKENIKPSVKPKEICTTQN